MRIWNHIRKTEICWEWSASKDKKGYGQVKWNGKMRRAHRVIYEICGGKLTPGLVIDHLCRNRGCVNPAHLEQVTPRENTRRGLTGAHQRVKTHCPSGHEYSGDNFRLTRTNERVCRVCDRNRRPRVK